MASYRKVFFSFHYDRDAWRAGQVRNSAFLPNVSAEGRFLDNASWETVRRQSNAAISRWINENIHGTSVTVVLVGRETASRPWVQYEITESRRRGNGLLGVRIHDIPSYRGPGDPTVDSPGADPFASVPDPLRPGYTLAGRYPIYNWNPSGRTSLAGWIENAARTAGR